MPTQPEGDRGGRSGELQVSQPQAAATNLGEGSTAPPPTSRFNTAPQQPRLPRQPGHDGPGPFRSRHGAIGAPRPWGRPNPGLTPAQSSAHRAAAQGHKSHGQRCAPAWTAPAPGGQTTARTPAPRWIGNITPQNLDQSPPSPGSLARTARCGPAHGWRSDSRPGGYRRRCN